MDLCIKIHVIGEWIGYTAWVAVSYLTGAVSVTDNVRIVVVSIGTENGFVPGGHQAMI